MLNYVTFSMKSILKIFRESVKAALTIPSKNSALNNLEDIINSGIKWGVRDTSGWIDFFNQTEVNCSLYHYLKISIISGRAVRARIRLCENLWRGSRQGDLE